MRVHFCFSLLSCLAWASLLVGCGSDSSSTDNPGGAATLHANDARRVPRRMEQMIQEVSLVPQQEVIAEAVNLIVHISKVREAPGRRVKEIVALRGYEDGRYQFETLG